MIMAETSGYWALMPLLTCPPRGNDQSHEETPGAAASSTRDELLMAAVDDYFSALHLTDVELLDQVFHPAAALFDVDQGQVTVDPYPAWRRDVEARPDPASIGVARSDEVTAVQWLSADAATVAVRITIFHETFVDHLCFVRDGERFRVVSKIWHLERARAD